jgi:hypothetical protein
VVLDPDLPGACRCPVEVDGIGMSPGLVVVMYCVFGLPLLVADDFEDENDVVVAGPAVGGVVGCGVEGAIIACEGEPLVNLGVGVPVMVGEGPGAPEPVLPVCAPDPVPVLLPVPAAPPPAVPPVPPALPLVIGVPPEPFRKMMMSTTPTTAPMAYQPHVGNFCHQCCFSSPTSL